MARADSTIRVNIVGDSKGLSKELKAADKGIAGLSSSMKGLIGAAALAGVGVAVTDFAQTALAEADRLGDATERLDLQLGALSEELKATSDSFSDLGLSAQDVLELEAAFADTATAIGLADPLIAQFADDAAATAGAIALLTDQEPDQVIDLIGKAAAGSEKAMRALGISVTDAEVEARALADTGKIAADTLTDQELAAAAYALVLDELKPKLDAARDGTTDLEQTQKMLEARWETLTGKIGQGLEGPLNDLLAWIIAGIEGWERFGEFVGLVEHNIRDLFGPVARLNDMLSDLIGNLQRATGGDFPTRPRNSGGGGGGGGGGSPNVNSNTGFVITGLTTHAEAERTVVAALRNHAARNGVQVDL